MPSETEDCVLFGDGRSSLALKPAGAPTEVGFPTQISVVAGPFRGAILDETVGRYEKFHRELVNLYQTLRGTAKLESYEHFSLMLKGSGMGGISVEVVTYGSHCPKVKLEYEFELDQTYLPPIIAGIERLFLRQEGVKRT